VTTTKTIFTRQDNFIGDVLVNLDPIKKRKIQNYFVWTKVGRKYYYVAFNLPKKMLTEMLKQDQFKGHLLCEDVETSELKPLTEETMKSLTFMAIHEIGFLISGVYIESQEALAYILKKKIK